MSGPTTTLDPVASGGDGVLSFPDPSYDAAVKPRARDVIGAVILAIVLVALVVWVVSIAAQGH